MYSGDYCRYSKKHVPLPQWYSIASSLTPSAKSISKSHSRTHETRNFSSLSGSEEKRASRWMDMLNRRKDYSKKGGTYLTLSQKRNRRKWTAPNNGRSCDSIPKALAISVDLGLLPPDTEIPTGRNKKRPLKPGRKPGRKPKRARPDYDISSEEEKEAFEEDEELIEEETIEDPEAEEAMPSFRSSAPPIFTDPETTLDGLRSKGLPRAVHWDPDSPDAKKIGWRVKVEYSRNKWAQGRIVRYDPFTHKHKVSLSDGKKEGSAWVWIRNDQHNLHVATRMVWARVKGYAWWPGLVYESNSTEVSDTLQIYFFGSEEVASLKDTEECIRPFSPFQVDAVVAKHSKKRNAKAFKLAVAEFHQIRGTFNDAVLFYARKAFAMSRTESQGWVGDHVEFKTTEGHADRAIVRKYSVDQRKWLIAFEDQEKAPLWIDVFSPNYSLKRVGNCSSSEIDEVVPYIKGFDTQIDHNGERLFHGQAEQHVVTLLQDRCRGCVGQISDQSQDLILVCQKCKASYHSGCIDPPISKKVAAVKRQNDNFVCPSCVPCTGCYRPEIVYGVQKLRSVPTNLSSDSENPLQLCRSCREYYNDNRYCPNCRHVWDDSKFQEVRREMKWLTDNVRGRSVPSSAPFSKCLVDCEFPLVMGTFTGDEDVESVSKAKASAFFPEIEAWGFKESDMLACDSCGTWVHAGCAGMSKDEYKLTTDGRHAIYSKEFLCRMCCRRRCSKLIEQLENEDIRRVFADPVDESVAPNYRDVIKEPMDLKTMKEKAEREEYFNYAWVRECFELMVFNALTFNRFVCIISLVEDKLTSVIGDQCMERSQAIFFGLSEIYLSRVGQGN